MKTSTLSVIIAAVTCLACEQTQDDKKNRSSCEQPATTVIGGVETSDFPETLMLRMYREDREQGICTASFYSQTTLVTAAHCFDYDIDEVSINLDGEIFTSSTFKIHPGYQQLSESGDYHFDVHSLDIAIVEFNMAGNEVKTVAIGKPVAPGEQLTIVGYGDHPDQSDDYDQRKKYRGEALVDRIEPDDEEILQIHTVPGSQAADTSARGASGDSGSTVFNAAGEAIGVLMGTHVYDAEFNRVDSDDPNVAVGSIIVDLNAPQVRSWLEGTYKLPYSHTEASQALPETSTDDSDLDLDISDLPADDGEKSCE